MQVSQIYGGGRKPNMQKSAALGPKQKYPTSGPGSLPLDIPHDGSSPLQLAPGIQSQKNANFASKREHSLKSKPSLT